MKSRPEEGPKPNGSSSGGGVGDETPSKKGKAAGGKQGSAAAGKKEVEREGQAAAAQGLEAVQIAELGQ